MPRIVGLTGGIASGKSMVARFLRDLGAEVIDADEIARRVVEPGEPALDEIVAAFGRQVLDGSGRLDRKRLGALIFADADARRRLNSITHPRIAAETAKEVAAAVGRGAELVIYEAALLVENGIHRMLGGLIVVATTPEIPRARLRQREQLTEEEALQRQIAQAPLDEKIAAADYVIDNNGTVDELRARVEALWRDLQREGRRM